jgi:RHS repeat-associated protein
MHPPRNNSDNKAEKNDPGKSTTVVPQLSLPKGGGAIRGMGEKFSANPVTGTGNLSVPIFTSPGRSGFGPQLALSYDSGNGNGPFGYGWSLSLPCITRKTDKGLPQYLDAEDSDVFILSGAEDLVPVPDYNPPEDDLYSIKHSIKRYRPRIEGLFARIECWTDKKTGENFWKSISKDNVTTFYGKTENSRIFEKNDNGKSRIFCWLISESYDDLGNAIYYEYKIEDEVGVDLSQLNEKNRKDNARHANRYLKYVRYGNLEPYRRGEDLHNPEWMFEVVFDYGKHDPDSPSRELGSWSVRKDPFSSYRAGFEVRTYRLCRRVLMFHHFPGKLETESYLVRSTDFSYKEDTTASFIAKIVQSGYVLKKKDEGIENIDKYLKKSLPALEFEYSKATINQEIKEIDIECLENLPIGLDGLRYQWVDLDGEGISGILTEEADAWYYKPNLGEGKFGPVQLVATKPSLADLSGGQETLMDLAADGQLDLVIHSGSLQGFYERNHDMGWEQFRSFCHSPNIDWKDPNLKFIDLTGDGHADLLISRDEVFIWHPSLAEDGFGPSERVCKPFDEECGPRLILADAEQSIYLADLSGDGLSDLVRIMNGKICYWPNLGYGRFGAKVTMDDSPWFDYPDQFDQRRIRLADIDGSGTTDIIYLKPDGAQIYFNQSGNSWKSGPILTQFPEVDNLSAATVVDLFGNGTACLAWSSPLPGSAGHQMRYIDLMGGIKPHLMVSMRNNMGAETRIDYVSSIVSYLKDKEEGRPWITKLPFPVHVVERMVVCDRISCNRFVTRYAYHHGYYDGIEREFRGFGLVEQWDTEEFALLNENDKLPSGENIDKASHVPPVLTKTWFHTGAYLDGEKISHQFAHEYYGAPKGEDEKVFEEFEKTLLPDTILPDKILLPNGKAEDYVLSADEAQEACRALKSSALRQEVYALDEDGAIEFLYGVSENSFEIKMLQLRGENRHAVFFVHPREKIDYHYERNIKDQEIEDPRIGHSFTLEVNQYGNVLKSAAVGYGRAKPDSSLNEYEQEKQTQILITYTENEFAKEIDQRNDYSTPLPYETRTYELTGLKPSQGPSPGQLRFSFEEIRKSLLEAKSIPYEASQDPGKKQKRLIEHVRTLYRSDDLSGPMPLGKIEPMALPYESYKLAFTPGLLDKVYDKDAEGDENAPEPAFLPGTEIRIYGGRVTDQMLEEGGYVYSLGDENWWIPSGKVYYSPNKEDSFAEELAFAREHFFLPHRFQDPFGNFSIVAFDKYSLLLQEVRDPLDNVVTTVIREENGEKITALDYRVLQPYLVVDPNDNRTEVAFDALGMVVATAVMGKVGANEGDLLEGFKGNIEMENLSQDDINKFFENPKGPISEDLLRMATTRIIYDINRYEREPDSTKKLPVFAAMLARETHVDDPLPEDGLKIQVSFSYSDGFGREIQKKIQAEPGPLEEGGSVVNPRWVGSGWTIFNNKGKPVKNYEPFFDDTHDFRFGNKVGVSSTLFYDTLERVVATLHPNHTYEKAVFDAWTQETWDVNDTLNIRQRFDPRLPGVLPGHDSDPVDDPHVGEYFKRLPKEEYWPTWYFIRADSSEANKEWPDVDPVTGESFPENAARRANENSAALKAARHSSTPTRVYLDTLGRTLLTIADNGLSEEGEVQEYKTRVELDIEGNQREVIDAKGRTVMRYEYDMLGNQVHQASMEAGERWVLNDVTGKPIRAWDSRNHAFRTEYDKLRRPVRSYVTGADEEDPEKEILFEATVFGEAHPNGKEFNLRAKPYMLIDSGGIVVNEDYDFKGNLLGSYRRFAKEFRSRTDWRPLENLTTPETSEPTETLNLSALKSRLRDLTEQEEFSTSMSYDALNRVVSQTAPDKSIIRPVYNEANLLEKLNVNLQGAESPRAFVENIDYDAKGQRTLIEYGNGVKTTYDYDEKTFRLYHLQTSCRSKRLQDLFYSYDPVGNITTIRDNAQEIRCYNQEVVKPGGDYIYDSIYRLVEANGREHRGLADLQHPTCDDSSRTRICSDDPRNWQALRSYRECYDYDEVGNIQRFSHYANECNWIRDYFYEAWSQIAGEESKYKNNRLTRTMVGGGEEKYTYNAHSSMESMVPHLRDMKWDFEEQLQSVDLGSGGTAFYVYDSGGQRVRKVIEFSDRRRNEERFYIGSFEVFRRYSLGNGDPDLERNTLHIMDDKQRIALVETRTKGEDGSLPQTIRYQLGNHLGSSAWEVDQDAKVITYEEYYPYGSTSFQSGRSKAEVKLKRYRYAGKERDEETGLFYNSARYLDTNIGRWISADPNWLEDGINLFAYAMNAPVSYIDPTGRGIEEYFFGKKLERASKIFSDATNALRQQKGKKPIAVKPQERVGNVIPDELKFRPGENPEIEIRPGENPKIEKATTVVELKARHIGSKRNQSPSARRQDILRNLEQVRRQLIEGIKEGRVAPNAKGIVWRVYHDSDKGKSTGKALQYLDDEAKQVRKDWIDSANDPAERASREKVVITSSTRDRLSRATKAVERSTQRASQRSGLGRVTQTAGGTARAVAPMAISWGINYLRLQNYNEASELREYYNGVPTQEQVNRQERAGWSYTGRLDDTGKPIWKYDPNILLRLREAIMFTLDPMNYCNETPYLCKDPSGA